MKKSTLILLINQIFSLFLSVILLAVVSFVILRSLPGGPFDSEITLHPLVKNNLEVYSGESKYLWLDLYNYLRLILSGSFGYSMVKTDQTVIGIIKSGLDQTIVLNFGSLIIIYILGVLLSVLAILNKNTWVEGALDQISLLFISLPALFIGPVLIYFFSIKLSLFPLAFLDSPIHFVLPIATLSLRPAAFLYRCLKNDLSISMQSAYIHFARAKGLSNRQIVWNHSLINSLDTVINYSSTLIVGTLSGSFLVEYMFSIHGIASVFLSSLESRDYTVVSGILLIFGILLYSLTSIFDFIRVLLDPRQRIDE